MEYIMSIINTEKAVIRVYRPILTEEERAEQMERIKKAAINLLRVSNSVNKQEKPCIPTDQSKRAKSLTQP